jgi:acyl-coenzyme A synthetase/AMP-(fatty) acid ligase
MFKVSGMWVSPFEVEAALASHEAVLEAAVIGKEDSDGLIKPKAFIVLRNGYAESEQLIEKLRVHVKTSAGPWKYPRWIDIRSDLPRTATGKIQRFKLPGVGRSGQLESGGSDPRIFPLIRAQAENRWVPACAGTSAEQTAG